MNPTQKDAVIGDSFREFLAALVGGAAGRKETLHFVTAREMANILLAACDGRDGNPGDYRDYRFKTHCRRAAAGGEIQSCFREPERVVERIRQKRPCVESLAW